MGAWVPVQERPHWVYLIFDAEGMPMYVGLTCNPVHRMSQHINTGLVVPGEDKVTYDGPYSYEDGRRQERKVIHNLRPMHNRQYNPDAARDWWSLYDLLPIHDWVEAVDTAAWRQRMQRKYGHLLEAVAA
jgi:hypothetical protein